ncbi:MAG: 5'-methylthioadenosine/S-adenosylhomocysteine nucleosidase [Clostridia bacterium]
MRPILIQGAMDIEVHLLIHELDAVLDQTIGGFDFYKGFLRGYPVVISKTNIGMSNASCATSISILTYNPALIINQGTAGAHAKNAHVSDLVIGLSSANICSFQTSAMDTGTDFKLWNHTDFRDCDDNIHGGSELQCDEILFKIFQNTPYSKGEIHTGVIGSGDVWNKEIEFIGFLNSTLHTLCEDMETVSVYNVANRFGVPVIGVRVISNNEIIKESYDKFSANNCQEFVLSSLSKIVTELSKSVF